MSIPCVRRRHGERGNGEEENSTHPLNQTQLLPQRHRNSLCLTRVQSQIRITGDVDGIVTLVALDPRVDELILAEERGRVEGGVGRRKEGDIRCCDGERERGIGPWGRIVVLGGRRGGALLPSAPGRRHQHLPQFRSLQRPLPQRAHDAGLKKGFLRRFDVCHVATALTRGVEVEVFEGGFLKGVGGRVEADVDSTRGGEEKGGESATRSRKQDRGEAHW
jgi:hypothetical protein